MLEAGLPEGVLSIITSSSTGKVMKPLIQDQRLRKLSFTGSTEVGRLLMEQASATLLKLSMELGGNAPYIVFEDADLDKAVEQAVVAKMRNMGESCVAANRFHVHESIAEEFTSRLADKLGALSVGRGTEEGVDVGPLIDSDQQGKVAELVDDAVSKGASVRTGGSKGDGAGYFYQPTVLGDVPKNARVLSEEIFGPVAPVATFSTEQEALDAANSSEFGLVAYVFTRDFSRAIRVLEGLEVGMAGLNKGLVSNPAAPFGGVKQSGFGREGGFEGIEEYLETKYIGIDI
jgi:succinate-semialdehyde dehydrogenase/glutarate-semialdehyde dehydrogenase